MKRKFSLDPQVLLVCPLCKGRLTFLPSLLTCTTCGREFPQSSQKWYDLMPDHRLAKDQEQWEERQSMMEEWYTELLVDLDYASICFNHDYKPYRQMLNSLSGLVLDIGGGNGIVRHFLPDNTEYISLDPSLDWLKTKWRALAKSFPCLEAPPFFVRGLGEYLPFPLHTFDVVLAFWSLNHASHPAQAVMQVHRVLKPGGRFVVVLEDMEPEWRDTAYYRERYKESGFAGFLRALWAKVSSQLDIQPWPVQSDHIRIREAQFGEWISDYFHVVCRRWVAGYLTLELKGLERTPPADIAALPRGESHASKQKSG